ncbi:Omp28-related outer membrane protein [Taibaiella chishuiensis]|uniref:Outer membrane protein Omp28 n=1 Tax=Taibaiella chishuiensis TaxID=1434707 RepID=A0A2P8CZ94_9BACT|nr:Omp28-related outer membrane protein [Taibaiella chishuiensis]PSK90298.1 outer membrane protein Omp28 [Taibaiella chishuiensis]
MKARTTLMTGCLVLLLIAGFTSCKEHGVSINDEENVAEETTYISDTVEVAQVKNFLTEEMSGVRCGNCPAGAIFLEELNEANGNRFRVVAIHQGSLTNMIKDRPAPKVNSRQDFTTVHGGKILSVIFGEQGNKPCVSFDRHPIGNGTNKYLVDGASNWPQKIVEMKTRRDKTPVNLKVESKFNAEKDQYEIKVTLHYTQAVTGDNNLFVYLTENDIKDAFIDSDTNITYNHVFRGAVTDPTGKLILRNTDKGPGRTYIYRSAFKIDKTDAKQAMWVPENMKVVAFVSYPGPEDKSVLQVQEVNLQ